MLAPEGYLPALPGRVLVVAVRGCTGPQGQPGYQWVDPSPEKITECHVYTAGDEGARRAALRAAIRDGDQEATDG